MKITRGNILISEKIGSVTFEVTDPGNPTVVMTLAHGAGADMDHRFMKGLADELGALGIATVRFNFPYMEKGKSRPDVPAMAHATIDRVLAHTRTLFPASRLVASGKSFGGRMTSQLLSKQNDHDVKAMVFYGFPLHPANVPGTDRAVHLKDVRIPMLFLQGTRDALAYPEYISEVCKSLPLAKLVSFEKADHSFKVGKTEIIVDLAKNTSEYLGDAHLL